MKKLEKNIIKAWKKEEISEAWNLSTLCHIYKKRGYYELQQL